MSNVTSAQKRSIFVPLGNDDAPFSESVYNVDNEKDGELERNVILPQVLFL